MFDRCEGYETAARNQKDKDSMNQILTSLLAVGACQCIASDLCSPEPVYSFVRELTPFEVGFETYEEFQEWTKETLCALRPELSAEEIAKYSRELDRFYDELDAEDIELASMLEEYGL